MAKKQEQKFNELGAADVVLNKVQTTQDGGARITLDLSSDSHEVIKRLIDCYLTGSKALSVGFVSVGNDGYK